MLRKISVITLKVIITSVLIYSVFMILFISTFDFLSLSEVVVLFQKAESQRSFYLQLLTTLFQYQQFF